MLHLIKPKGRRPLHFSLNISAARPDRIKIRYLNPKFGRLVKKNQIIYWQKKVQKG